MPRLFNECLTTIIMNTIKYLTPFYTFLLTCLIPLSKLSAQDWNYQAGINSANFRYQSPTGLAQKSILADAGLHHSILLNNRLIDSSKTKSKFLKKLNYQRMPTKLQKNVIKILVNINTSTVYRHAIMQKRCYKFF